MQLALDRKHFNFLVADLQAAAFCIEVIDEPDDRIVGRKFLSIHQFFLRNIDRDRPELFAGVDRALLVDLVRRWMRLYLLALAEVRRRFPRTDDSPDLVMKGRNWSEELDVSFEGLDRLDIASRYAEFWAERSIHDPAIRATFGERCAMVGSPAYVEYDQLHRDHQLLIVDGFTNGIPSYDLQRAMRELAHPDQLEESFGARGWRIRAMTPRARAALVRWRDHAR